MMARRGAAAALLTGALASTGCGSQPTAQHLTPTTTPTTAAVASPPAVSDQASGAILTGPGTSSMGDSTSVLDVVSDGRTPLGLMVTVSAPDCSQPVEVHLTATLSRGGSPLPGGLDTPLTSCGTFPQHIPVSAGPVHVVARARSTGNVAVEVTSSARGATSHTFTSNNSGDGLVIP